MLLFGYNNVEKGSHETFKIIRSIKSAIQSLRQNTSVREQ